MTTRRTSPVIVCVLIALVWAIVQPCAFAAPDKKIDPQHHALIFGTVWTAKGAPAPGVKIKIRREQDKKPRWEHISDSRGEFAQRVPAEPADYVVWADIKLPKGKSPPVTKVHIEKDERTDISLHLTE